MLAQDGRCKTLDASGDGYVRAENCLLMLMELLSSDASTGAAAVVVGTAVNQVGMLKCPCCLDHAACGTANPPMHIHRPFAAALGCWHNHTSIELGCPEADDIFSEAG